MFNLIFSLIMALVAGCGASPATTQDAPSGAPRAASNPAPASNATVVVTRASSGPARGSARPQDEEEEDVDTMVELGDLPELAEIEGLETVLDPKSMEAVRQAFRVAQGALERAKPALRWAAVAGNSPQLRRLRLEGIQYEDNAAFLGVATEPVGAQTAAQLPIAPGCGLVVTTVEKDSPAAAAGLQPFDVLTLMGDQILVNMEQLSVLIRSRKPGDAVTFTYLRGGKQATATATLGAKRLPKLGAGGQRLDGGLFNAEDDVFVVAPQGQTAEITLARLAEERSRAAAGGPAIVRPLGATMAPSAPVSRSDVSMRYTTDDAAITYAATEDGVRMTVKDVPGGQVVFDEARTPTPDEIAAFRPEIRAAVERMLKDVRAGGAKPSNRLRSPGGPATRGAPALPAPPAPPAAPAAPAAPVIQATGEPMASASTHAGTCVAHRVAAV